MNEAETRAEYIDQKLKDSGWGVIEGSKISREYNITAGRIQTGGKRVIIRKTYGKKVIFLRMEAYLSQFFKHL